MSNVAALNLWVAITLFCWGIWGILDKKALEHGSYGAVALRFYALTMIEVPCIYLVLNATEPGWEIPAAVWYLTFWAAFLQVFAIFAYLIAMSMTDASYVLGITAAYPLVLQFLALIFLKESLILERIIGAAAIGFGVAAISWSPGTSSKVPKEKRWLLILCVIAATVGWGVWGVFDKLALEKATPLAIFLAERAWELLFFLLAMVVFLLRRDLLPDTVNLKSWIYVTLSGFSLAIGRWTFLNALALASASYVIAITGCYPLLMYFLALLFLKEPFNKTRFVGILLVVVGGIAVQLTQS